MSHRYLILSVGYGQGHHAAAHALARELKKRGDEAVVADPCAEAGGMIFRLTQRFYRFCVRRAPWLWGITYGLTDTADWAHAVTQWPLTLIVSHVAWLLRESQPDVVLCTYPLYAYMLDILHHRGIFHGHYAVIVTDAREISRPWMLSQAPLIGVPDAGSRRSVLGRYAMAENRVVASGFPVADEFRPSAVRSAPTADCLTLIYGAYCPYAETVRDLEAVAAAFPRAAVTVLAGRAAKALRRRFRRRTDSGQWHIVASTPHMAELMQRAHLYIGKAGAATVFECYASRLPVLVRFALPGQEQGNAALLEEDGAGVRVSDGADLTETISRLLADDAAIWHRMQRNMQAAGYDGAAARIIDATERRFFE